MGRNFRPIKPRFPYRAETWEQKPTEPRDILTILNLRGGNMGIGEPSLSSSQPSSFSSSVWLWVEVSDLLCFYAFSALSLLAFWFSLVKAPLAFCSLYIWNFGLDSPQINTSKEPKGRFGPFLHFRPLSQKRPRHFGDSTGESSSWHKRNGASKGVEPAKRWRDGVSHTNLSFQRKLYDALLCKKSIVKLSLKKFYL